VKPLVSPYLWLIVAQGAALLWWWRRARGTPVPRALRVVIGCWWAMALLSFYPASDAIGALLDVADSPPAAAPDVIFVLGDGLRRGATAADDRVTETEFDRVRTAAAWWKEGRSARIVVSGRSHAEDRDEAQLGRLARGLLVAQGVPDSVITIEPRSRTTWEHVGEALKLPGVTRANRVGIVTSGWHMRRARIVFRGAFSDLQWRSVPGFAREWRWPLFLPSALALEESGLAAQELVGAVAYRARRIVSTP